MSGRNRAGLSLILSDRAAAWWVGTIVAGLIVIIVVGAVVR